MNKRIRKKWLKKHGLYVNPRDTWNLDMTISEFILPRLKLFKKESCTYPGRGEMDTPEKWDDALQKMIDAFQLVLDIDNVDDKYWTNGKFNEALWKVDNKRIKKGLHLFATWFESLWW